MAQSVSRSQILACVVAAAVILVGGPAMAKKKKSADPSEPATETSSTKSEGASQAADTERPKPIADENQEAPASDEKGNVSFVGARAGKGKIIVKGPSKEKVKVYLEGKYFGNTPRTINKIPPGDYIVEGIFPDGKSVTKPVSVSSDEEVVVELAPSDAVETGPKEKLMPADQAEKRWELAKVVGIASVGVLVVGGVFGYLEYATQQDYNKAAVGGDQATLDSLASKGNRYALVANSCFIAGAVGLVASAIIGYPAYKARKAERRPESPDTALSFMIAPTPNFNGASAGMLLRF